MKKSVNMLAAVGVVGLMLASNNAVANMDNIKFYAGAGINYGKYGVNKEVKDILKTTNTTLKDKGFGVLVPIIGVKFHDNFGVEAGYGFNKKIGFKANVAGSSDNYFKVKNAYVDFMANAPIVDQLDVIGGIGVGKLMVKTPKDNNLLSVSNKFGVRFKAGVQYNLNNNVGARALAAYQSSGSKFKEGTIKDKKFVKSLTSVNLDVLYTF